jgi:predicted nucleic acid-binding protein
MNVYADSGFVVSLYKAETTSAAAAKAMRRLQGPVWLSPLSELEIRNAFQLAVFRSEIDSGSALRKQRLFADDLAKGIFLIQPVPAAALHAKAIELAERHSATLGTRSLDLMHVSAALILKADRFLSFDERQKKVAKKEGLTISL